MPFIQLMRQDQSGYIRLHIIKLQAKDTPLFQQLLTGSQ